MYYSYTRLFIRETSPIYLFIFLYAQVDHGMTTQQYKKTLEKQKIFKLKLCIISIISIINFYLQFVVYQKVMQRPILSWIHKVHKMEQKLGESEEALRAVIAYTNHVILFKDNVFGAFCGRFIFQFTIINLVSSQCQFINQIQPQPRMSVQIIAKEQTLNRRQLYKNQKLQQINQIYYCECGKNYLTFSALYLHARNKHEVKLTTKRTPLNCRVDKKEEKIIVTYFIQEKSTEQHQSAIQSPHKLSNQIFSPKNQRYAAMIQLIDQYLSQENDQNLERKAYRNTIMEQLTNYFNQLEEIEEPNTPTDGDSITIYFNDFIAYYLPLAHSQKIISDYALHQAENVLIRFWRWLREFNHTQSQLLHRTYPTPFFP